MNTYTYIFYLDKSLNKFLGCWNWVCSIKGPDQEFICQRIAENRLEIRWAELAYRSGGQTFNVNGHKITTPEDPAIEGTCKKDGSVVFCDVSDKEVPVAVWSRKGIHVFIWSPSIDIIVL